MALIDAQGTGNSLRVLRRLQGQIEFLSRHCLKLADMRHHLTRVLADTISTGREVMRDKRRSPACLTLTFRELSHALLSSGIASLQL